MIRLTLILLSISLISSSPLKLTLFDSDTINHFGAKCLDGSGAGYYFRNSSAKSSELGFDAWIIYLEGGGVCAEPVDCEVRKSTHLGSSTYWKGERYDDVDVLSDDPRVNPFYDWNHVFVPYCTGDTHTGTMREFDLLGFHFSGHNNLEAMLDDLREKDRLNDARHVLLTGASAGGIGVFNNADFMKDQFPNATFKAVPKAGYFFPHDVTLYETWLLGLDIPYPVIAAEYLSNWYHSYLDKSCVEKNPDYSGRCWDASFVYPYIESDILIVENIFDASLLQFLGWVNIGEEGKKFMAYFGDTMVNSIQQVSNSSKPSDGYFMPACYDHTGNLCTASETKVAGYSYREILFDWYFQVNKLPHQLIDSCWSYGSQPCNSVCPRLCG